MKSRGHETWTVGGTSKAESFQTVAVRLEKQIAELEAEKKELLLTDTLLLYKPLCPLFFPIFGLLKVLELQVFTTVSDNCNPTRGFILWAFRVCLEPFGL